MEPDLGSRHPERADRLEFTIRPGVRFPDWSRIRSPSAEAALLTMFRAVGIERRWTRYPARLDKVRVAVLRFFVANGRGPDVTELTDVTGMAEPEVRSILQDLAHRDLVVLDGGQRAVGAYPFTERETGHIVRRGGVSNRAMCAVDALGTGAMLDEDAEILSRCRACGASIRATTAERGSALASIEPPGSVVWVGEVYRGNCGATSLCQAISFFCSDDHLDRWRATAEEGAARGHRLTGEEAHQVGCAIFAPALSGAAT